MVYGSKRVWLPRVLVDRTISAPTRSARMMDRDHSAPDLDRAVDPAALLAVLAPPRRPRHRLHRAGPGDLVTLPIPLGNWLPAFSTALLGLALSERDGLLFALGSVVGVAAMAVVASVIGAAGVATHPRRAGLAALDLICSAFVCYCHTECKDLDNVQSACMSVRVTASERDLLRAGR